MAIKISSTDVIDNNKNIVNTVNGNFSGIVTAASFSGNVLPSAQNVTSSSPTTTINLSLGTLVYLTHNVDTTIAFSNVSTNQEVTIIRTKDDTNTSRSITWPSSVKWPELGSAPVLLSNSGSNDAHIFTLVTRDGGTTWFAREESKYQGTGTFLFGIGNNSSGGLLDGTQVSRSSPVLLPGTGWNQVHTGIGGGTLASKTDGTLWGFGNNVYGQIGIGDVISRSSPVQIGSGTDWTGDISHAYYTSCAIKTGGTLWAWGYNEYGTVGDGTVISRSSPVQVGADTNWSANNVYLHILACKTTGTLWAWGRGDFGALGGVNNVLSRSSPVQIGSGTDWSTSISCGEYTSYAIKTGGTLWAWGYNVYGQIGDGTVINRSSPVQIGSGTDWSKVFASNYSAYAIKTGGTLWAWGYNVYGQIGDGTVINRSSPVQIGSSSDWAEVIPGQNQALAVKTNGTLWVIGGINANGELGWNNPPYPPNSAISSPVQIGSDTNWNGTDMSSKNNYSFLVKKVVS